MRHEYQCKLSRTTPESGVFGKCQSWQDVMKADGGEKLAGSAAIKEPSAQITHPLSIARLIRQLPKLHYCKGSRIQREKTLHSDRAGKCEKVEILNRMKQTGSAKMVVVMHVRAKRRLASFKVSQKVHHARQSVFLGVETNLNTTEMKWNILISKIPIEWNLTSLLQLNCTVEQRQP